LLLLSVNLGFNGTVTMTSLLFFVFVTLSLQTKNFKVIGTCKVPENVFDRVYANGERGMTLVEPRLYYSYGNLSRIVKRSSSGWGSDIGPSTSASLHFLSDVITEYGITSLLDLPCGDANWQFESWEMDSLPIYVGGDIARAVVALDKEKFQFHSNNQFVIWDLSTCRVPRYRRISREREREQSFVFCAKFRLDLRSRCDSTFASSQRCRIHQQHRKFGRQIHDCNHFSVC
jgi:hypothetical protein